MNRGIPIGNLTSQLFANVYMNEFDQFVKHILNVRYYTRYTDDLAIVSGSRAYLENLLPPIEKFLKDRLALSLHPKKVTIRQLEHGIDFLGYVIFPNHRLVRTKTKRRIWAKLLRRRMDYENGVISKNTYIQSLQSYLGVFSHADAYAMREKIMNEFWISD